MIADSGDNGVSKEIQFVWLVEMTAAHGRIMNAKLTSSFFAHGQLTGSAVWTSSDLPSLIAALSGDDEYLKRDAAGRLNARERASCQLATRTQAGLLLAAVHAETWSWEGASLGEIERLKRPREVTDRCGEWTGSMPLILVRPHNDRSWKAPAGRVKVISPLSDSSLLWGMRELGLLDSAGRLDSSGGTTEPRTAPV